MSDQKPTIIWCLTDGCGWEGQWDDLLQAPNPFDPSQRVWGCPGCKKVTGTAFLEDDGSEMTVRQDGGRNEQQ